MKPTVLVLGDTGKLGRALVASLEVDFNIHTVNSSNGLIPIDLDNLDGILISVKPQVVINCIALNGLGPCNQNPNKAFLINAQLPGLLADLSNEMNFKLIHFSTDNVFDGKIISGHYVESDTAAALNVYGATKYFGDCLIQARAKDYYIFRLSLLAGDTSGRSPQLIEKMINMAREGETISAATDIICSPTFVNDVSREVLTFLNSDKSPGVYHLANSGDGVSLFDLFTFIFSELKLNSKIEPVLCSSINFPDLKPLYTAIASSRGIHLRSWRKAIKEYCSELH